MSRKFDFKRFSGAMDAAGFEEGKHKRDKSGQFASGSGGGGGHGGGKADENKRGPRGGKSKVELRDYRKNAHQPDFLRNLAPKEREKKAAPARAAARKEIEEMDEPTLTKMLGANSPLLKEILNKRKKG